MLMKIPVMLMVAVASVATTSAVGPKRKASVRPRGPPGDGAPGSVVPCPKAYADSVSGGLGAFTYAGSSTEGLNSNIARLYRKHSDCSSGTEPLLTPGGVSKAHANKIVQLVVQKAHDYAIAKKDRRGRNYQPDPVEYKKAAAAIAQALLDKFPTDAETTFGVSSDSPRTLGSEYCQMATYDPVPVKGEVLPVAPPVLFESGDSDDAVDVAAPIGSLFHFLMGLASCDGQYKRPAAAAVVEEEAGTGSGYGGADDTLATQSVAIVHIPYTADQQANVMKMMTLTPCHQAWVKAYIDSVLRFDPKMGREFPDWFRQTREHPPAKEPWAKTTKCGIHSLPFPTFISVEDVSLLEQSVVDRILRVAPEDRQTVINTLLRGMLQALPVELVGFNRVLLALTQGTHNGIKGPKSDYCPSLNPRTVKVAREYLVPVPKLPAYDYSADGGDEDHSIISFPSENAMPALYANLVQLTKCNDPAYYETVKHKYSLEPLGYDEYVRQFPDILRILSNADWESKRHRTSRFEISEYADDDASDEPKVPPVPADPTDVSAVQSILHREQEFAGVLLGFHAELSGVGVSALGAAAEVQLLAAFADLAALAEAQYAALVEAERIVTSQINVAYDSLSKAVDFNPADVKEVAIAHGGSGGSGEDGHDETGGVARMHAASDDEYDDATTSAAIPVAGGADGASLSEALAGVHDHTAVSDFASVAARTKPEVIAAGDTRGTDTDRLRRTARSLIHATRSIPTTRHVEAGPAEPATDNEGTSATGHKSRDTSEAVTTDVEHVPSHVVMGTQPGADVNMDPKRALGDEDSVIDASRRSVLDAVTNPVAVDVAPVVPTTTLVAHEAPHPDGSATARDHSDDLSTGSSVAAVVPEAVGGDGTGDVQVESRLAERGDNEAEHPVI